MSSLEKIINIERSVNIYNNKDSELVEEILIELEVEKLKEIVVPNENDPQLYESYVLTPPQLEKINQLIPDPIEPDFSVYFYVLEATAIYDWSAN